MRRVPSKLPQAIGEGAVAEGFKLSFDKINEILEFLTSIQPMQSAKSDINETVVGVTRTPRGTGDGTTGDEDEAGRWA